MDRPITEYQIHTHYHAPSLEESVNEAIKEGWEPFGAVSVARSEYYDPHHGESFENVTYAQAMVKRAGGL